MKRLWQNTGQGGLLKRRDKEAEVFQAGLDNETVELGLSEVSFSEADPVVSSAARAVPAAPEADEDALAEGLDAEGDILRGGATTALEATRPKLSIANARWPNSPANAPDTWHLPAQTADMKFEMTADVLRALLQVGHFEPHAGSHNKLIVALRGCRLADGSASTEDALSVIVETVNPDHETYRCLMGVWDQHTDRLSFYTGSTSRAGLVCCGITTESISA